MEHAARQLDDASPRRVEVLAALSVAIDLGLGQPAEHMLRSALISGRLAARLGLTREQQATVYYTSLTMWIGCHADSTEYARWFGDDIAVRRDSLLVDWSGLPFARFLVTNVARGEPMAARLATMLALFRDARGHLAALLHSHCLSAASLARHIGLGVDVERALGFAFERYDGAGLPRGCPGAEIPIEMRVAQLADTVEVHRRLFGVDAAVETLRRRRGGHLDPLVVDALVAAPEQVLADAPGSDVWRAAIDAAPDTETRLDTDALDRLVCAVGDFADLKCPFMLGHSRGVATLAVGAANKLGLERAEAGVLLRAGHLHDVGRLGVSNQIWSKPGKLTAAEWERVRMHPYLTDRVLSRIRGLERERTYARAHHERLDGSGYPLGTSGAELGLGARILAAAVEYQSALEPRPYRDAMEPERAARRVQEGCRAGQLDQECVDAVLAVAGRATPGAAREDALTPREREVLGWVARGLSNREIAGKLVLSEKTVRNHVEHTYAKIGASNRVGASLYALEHGLVPRA